MTESLFPISYTTLCYYDYDKQVLTILHNTCNNTATNKINKKKSNLIINKQILYKMSCSNKNKKQKDNNNNNWKQTNNNSQKLRGVLTYSNCKQKKIHFIFIFLIRI